MRRLMWFSAGFALACGVGAYVLASPWILIGMLLSLLGAVGLSFLKTKWTSVAAMVLWGVAVGALWFYGFDAAKLAPACSYDGQTVALSITVTDDSYIPNYGTAADGVTVLENRSYKVRFYIDELVDLRPGDRVEGRFRMRYTAVGGEKEPTYHSGRGIYLLAYSEEPVSITYSTSVPLRYYPVVLRRQITNILDQVFPEEGLAFARALLLGDTSLLSYETDTALQTSGIRHVIAVSGLHVSILFSFVYQFAGKKRGLTALFGLPVLLLFAAVAGFTPSILRACMMQALMILAMLLNKEYDPPTALGVSALVMLVLNPLTVTSVSFQLSIGCMLGMFLFSERINRWLLDEKRLGSAKGKGIKARMIRWTVHSVSATVSAMIVTTPLCACYFSMVSLVGVVTNLLTLWAVSIVFYGVMAACVAGAVWLPLGQCIGWLVTWLIRYILTVSKGLSSLPLAAVYTDSIYIVLWLVFCYLLFGIFLLPKGKRPLLLGGCMTAGLCVALIFSWLEPVLCDYRIVAIDVGQGQSILLQQGKQNYLVDCGGEYEEEAADVIAARLLSQGIFRLDGLILTHYDSDHAGAAKHLMTRIPADRIYLPNVEDESGIREQLEKHYGHKITWIAPASVRQPEENLKIIAAAPGKTGNESSLCILFQPENCDILITGDRGFAGERALLRTGLIPDVEILVAGHHGAKTSTCLELLHQAKPELVIISAGEGNRYGHPAEATLERLDLFGCRVLRTDQMGTIILRG